MKVKRFVGLVLALALVGSTLRLRGSGRRRARWSARCMKQSGAPLPGVTVAVTGGTGGKIASADSGGRLVFPVASPTGMHSRRRSRFQTAEQAFWTRRLTRHRDAAQPVLAWYGRCCSADWATPAAVKAQFRTASILQDGRVVFNLAGNKYRLVVWINYPYRVVYVRFIGTHRQYDAIDAQTNLSRGEITMDIKPIRTQADYKATLKTVESLMNARRRHTPEGDRLDVLVTLLEAYERKRFPMDLRTSGAPTSSATAPNSKTSAMRAASTSAAPVFASRTAGRRRAGP